MTGTSFQHHKRGAMTAQRRARLFQERGGRCAGKCGRKLGPKDDWDLDHIIALENGGTDDDDNLRVLCDWCHSEKTSEDHATAGHGRRMATKHCVPKRFWKGNGWR